MKKVLVVISLLASLLSIHSQDIDYSLMKKKEIIKIIDQGIEDKSETVATLINTLGVDFQDYSYYESYVLEKTKELMEIGNLEYSLILVEAVLYNNLENSKAQKLYTEIIEKRIELDKRREAEALLAEIKRDELDKLEKEVVEELSKEEFMASLVTTSEELFQVVDTYSDSYMKRNYRTTSYFYPFTTKYYSSEVYDGFVGRDSYTNSYDGLGVDLSISSSIGRVATRFDSQSILTFEDFIDEDIYQFTGSGTFSFGFIGYPFYFRTGVLLTNYQFDSDDDIDVAITSLLSPTVGIGIVDVPFLHVCRFTLTGDMLLSSIQTDNLDLALNGRSYLTINLFRFGSQNFELRGGIDLIYFNEGGLYEISYTPLFGIGVSSNE